MHCSVYGYEPVAEERSGQRRLLTRTPTITCGRDRRWHPDLAEDHACVKKCSQQFVGDGWCDFQNNRGYCGWDGGDCCASTAREGRVRLMFPALCTSQLCSCLDPYADENLRPADTRTRKGRGRKRNRLHSERAKLRGTYAEFILFQSHHICAEAAEVAEMEELLQRLLLQQSTKSGPKVKRHLSAHRSAPRHAHARNKGSHSQGHYAKGVRSLVAPNTGGGTSRLHRAKLSLPASARPDRGGVEAFWTSQRRSPTLLATRSR